MKSLFFDLSILNDNLESRYLYKSYLTSKDVL